MIRSGRGFRSSSARRPWRKRVGMLAVATTLAVVGSATAAQMFIEDIKLTPNGGTTRFDYGFNHGCVDGTSFSQNIHTYSVDDAKHGSGSDAFDGALPLYVDGRPFTVPSETANKIGTHTIQSPTRTLSGLKVSRVGHTIPDEPILRELIKFANPSKTKTVRVPATFATEYGSDTETVVLASSSGDAVFNRRDRWGITADDPTAVSDPAVTLVNYGKGTVLKPINQVGPFSTPDDGNAVSGADCAIDTFLLKLKPKQTGYLMFFLELNDSITAASEGARKFNSKSAAGLLGGMSKSQQARVLNWDLR